jgi:hypothetical protein
LRVKAFFKIRNLILENRFKIKRMIRKSILYVVLSFLLFTSCSNENNKYDSRAILSLDKMSESIGELSSCSYTINIVNNENDSVQIVKEHDVYMSGPDKMYIYSKGAKGTESYWFDGESLSYFSYSRNEYTTVVAPGTTIEGISFLHEKYGIDFPASDFFYPELTDDLMANYESILYSEDDSFDDLKSITIVCSNANETLKIWINKDSNLPLGMLITSKISKGTSYEAVFSNLKVNPKLTATLFEFSPPKNSKKFQLQPKK